MSLFRSQQRAITAESLIPQRTSARRGNVVITNDTALRHSAVWACLRLRSNLVSTMPVDLYRRVAGVQVEVPKPKVLVSPGGDRIDMAEWLYSSQFDLDRAGNAFGLITERDGLGFPSRIDLVSLSDVTVIVRDGELFKYRIGQVEYDPSQVWHERQYTVAGLHVGLSPVAYAAWSIGEYLSIQEFALEWFGNSTVPAAHLRNTAKTLNQDQATEIKTFFNASVSAGEPFVTGQDWEYTPLTAANQATNWIEGKQYGVADIARFFDCPGDLIDAAVSTGNITYASITQRNLQFLIMHLGPAVIRRENALSRLTSRPRFVKLNTDALLRMDPATRATTVATQITSRVLAPSEARALDDRPPFTPDQLAEFDQLFGSRAQAPTKTPPVPEPMPGS